MKYDIKEFENLVKEGYLRKSEAGDLILFGYTDRTTFERNWNQYTKVARGLILNKNTGEVVAKPFNKFFNLSEMEEVFLSNLPLDKPYKAYEKVDGSLGIIFNYEGYWNVATRGSFHSEQAGIAQQMLKNYNLSAIPTNITLLAEIIYPENKIIVDYKGQKKLVLLAAFDRDTCEEIHPDKVAQYAQIMFMEMAKSYDYTIEQMIALQKTLPKDEEGFVVRFENGLRVKIKGEEYLRIAKTISQMSPISFWESMENGIVKREYLTQLPEEFRQEFEPIVKELEDQYKNIANEIQSDLELLPTQALTPEGRKTIGLFLKDTKSIKHKAVIFPLLQQQNSHVDKYILKTIRPTGNSMKVFE